MTSGALVAVAAAAALLAVVVQGVDRGRPVVGPDPTRDVDLAGRSAWAAVIARVRPGPPAPVRELMAGLAAELAAGQPTGAALEQAAAGLDPDPCPRARRVARYGGDVAAALRQDATARGAEPLRSLAACWEVAEQSGAGLSLAVGRLAEGLRASERARAELAGEVAAVRTSARLLALLPLFGLLIGQWIGADPLDWLVGGWAGRAVLAAGLLLQGLGVLWLRRMVAAVRTEL